MKKNSISPQHTKKGAPKKKIIIIYTHTHIIFFNLEIKVFLCSEEENISDKNMRKTKKNDQKMIKWKMENKFKIEKNYEAAATLRPSFVFPFSLFFPGKGKTKA